MSSVTQIAIIGANSFLAKHLATILSKEGVELHFFGKTPPANLRPADQYTYFEYPGTGLDFRQLLDKEFIINASSAGVQATSTAGNDVLYEINAFLPIRLTNYLEKEKYNGLLFTFGSYFEIGNNKCDHKFTEDDVIKVTESVPNHYCGSKRLLTRFFSNGNFSIQHYHLILPTIYGPQEFPHRLIPYLVSSIISNQKVQLTNGDQTREYLHISDLCELIVMLMNEKPASGIYNVSGAGIYKVKEVVEIVYKALGKKISASFGDISREDTSMQTLKLNGFKLSNAINWVPLVSLHNSIIEYEQYLKNNISGI